MPSIGDLANDLASWAYDRAFVVIIASFGIASVLAVVSVRLGWIASARRHPGRTASAIALAVLLASPVAWYLGSPVFLRSELVEAAPLALGPDPSAVIVRPTALPSIAPSSHLPSTTPPKMLEPVAPSTPVVSAVLAVGRFAGTDDFHFGRGTATLLELTPGRLHLRLDDFSVRNGPDLYVYLSPDPHGFDAGAVEIGKLKATDGAFGYDLPPGTDPSTFRSALIWCKQFSHLFAVATFGA